jgi:hypothetical protein
MVTLESKFSRAEMRKRDAAKIKFQIVGLLLIQSIITNPNETSITVIK